MRGEQPGWRSEPAKYNDEKALDCRDAIIELNESIAELYQNKFDDVVEDYENQLSLLEHLTNTYNNAIDDLEERGYLATTKYYEALQQVEEQNIATQQKELDDLITQMSEAMNSGYIEEGSNAWNAFQTQINDVKESIQEAETSMVEFANSIREVKWDHFDYLQEQISNITEEADFLIDLMESSDLYTDNGQLTDIGRATMGLHGQNYNVYMEQANKYAEELLALNEEIANDPNNTTLLDRREELLESQRDAILAAEDEKQAIVDLVQDGIDLELEALQDLIDDYENALDSEKDLYDYQQKVKEQSSNISSLQKQISAYAGDTSEETQAKLQQLKTDLLDAQQELEETQYDQRISEQKKILDQLYDEYESILNARLDNVDRLISDMIDMLNENSASIYSTITQECQNVGTTLSDAMNTIWSNGGQADTVLGKYGSVLSESLSSLGTINTSITSTTGAISSMSTAVQTALNNIASKIDSMIKASDTTATTTTASTTSTTATDTSVTPVSTKGSTTTRTSTTTTPAASTTSTTTSTTTSQPSLTKGSYVQLKSGHRWYSSSDGQSPTGYPSNYNNKYKITRINTASWATKPYLLENYGWVAKSDIVGYKTGGAVTSTGLAWLDGTPSKPETVLSAKDTKHFIALKDAMESVANGDSPLAALFNNGVSSTALDTSSLVGTLPNTAGTTVGDVTYQINIPIDHVEDYDDFVNKMRSDSKFEKMIQSMTVDRMAGGSKMAKNKYQW